MNGRSVGTSAIVVIPRLSVLRRRAGISMVMILPLHERNKAPGQETKGFVAATVQTPSYIAHFTKHCVVHLAHRTPVTGLYVAARPVPLTFS